MLTEARPGCPCHGEPMYWNKDLRLPAGGYWRCAVVQRDRVRARYHRDPARKLATARSYYYERMPTRVRVKRDLRERRRKALIRRRNRQLRRAES